MTGNAELENPTMHFRGDIQFRQERDPSDFVPISQPASYFGCPPFARSRLASSLSARYQSAANYLGRSAKFKYISKKHPCCHPLDEDDDSGHQFPPKHIQS